MTSFRQAALDIIDGHVIAAPSAASACSEYSPSPILIGRQCRGRPDLSTPYSLDGLIAWSRRDEWREPFGTLLDLHTGRACVDAGISLARLGELLDDHVTPVVFGAVFENLLAVEDDRRTSR